MSAAPYRLPSCRGCEHARYSPAPGKVGCALLSDMSPVQVLRAVGGELHRMWRGRAHPAAHPDTADAPTEGFSDRRVIVPATDRCSRFKPRLRVA